MYDLVSLVIPKMGDNEEVLLVDVSENVTKLTAPLAKPIFLEKLEEIDLLYSKKVTSDNHGQCCFTPFVMVRDLKYDESINIVKEALNKVSKKSISIRGQIFLSRRFIFYPHVNYKFVIYFTDPIEPNDLKMNKTFWCHKDQLKMFNDTNSYFLIGNELEQMLQLKDSKNFSTKYEKSLQEYKFRPYSNSLPFGFTKTLSLHHKIIVQSNCDEWVQNYIFADFMMNSYPSQVMCYPQFIGFAVARGFYMKRCLKLFQVLKKDQYKYLSFEEFLHGCICMDLSSPHEGDLRLAREILIFKYYDNNSDTFLDFTEMLCLVKQMRKKMALEYNIENVILATENIMRLLNTNTTIKSIREAKISLEAFKGGLDLPELQGLTYLLRFKIKYVDKTRFLMKKYMESIEVKAALLGDMNAIGVDYSLIPYFISEAYSSNELLASMINYSTNYGAMQTLLQKMDEKNKVAIAKYKVGTLFSGFITQVFYYLSEIVFDIYNREVSFPLRNPIFLIILFTAIAIVDPQIFHSSTVFWNNILAFFIYNAPALILALRSYRRMAAIEIDAESPILQGTYNHWTNRQKEKEGRRQKMVEDNSYNKDLEKPKDNKKDSYIKSKIIVDQVKQAKAKEIVKEKYIENDNDFKKAKQNIKENNKDFNKEFSKESENKKLIEESKNSESVSSAKEQKNIIISNNDFQNMKEKNKEVDNKLSQDRANKKLIEESKNSKSVSSAKEQENIIISNNDFQNMKESNKYVDKELSKESTNKKILEDSKNSKSFISTKKQESIISNNEDFQKEISKELEESSTGGQEEETCVSCKDNVCSSSNQCQNKFARKR